MEYNKRVETCQRQGIQLAPIDNPYPKPYRECLKDDLEKLLSGLQMD